MRLDNISKVDPKGPRLVGLVISSHVGKTETELKNVDYSTRYLSTAVRKPPFPDKIVAIIKLNRSHS